MESVSTQLKSRRLLAVLMILAAFTPGCMTTKPDAPAAAKPSKPEVTQAGGTAKTEQSEIQQAQALAPTPNLTPVRMLPNDLPVPKAAPSVSNTPPAKPGEVSRLTAAFSNKVIYAPDPTRGGDPVPGLLGRLYIFSTDEAVPIEAEGDLVVDVWDNSPKINGGKPKLMEVWHLDPTAFAKFRKRDIIGEGYSIFLPWSTYNIDVRQINVIVRFSGKDGRVLMTPPEALSVDHATTLQRAADKIGGITGEPVSRIKE